MKTLRKIIFRFLILPVIAFLVLVIAAAALLYFQQERVVKLAVGELNKRLPGELVIGGSNISIFQNFPYVSIALKNVRFYAAKQPGSSQSLFEAEKIYAGFSLPDILKQHYRVKVISLKNGHLSLVEGADGRLNIVEAARMNTDTATGASDSSAALNLALKKIVLRNLDISFLDKASGQQLACHIDKIQSAFRDDSLHIYSSLQGNLMADLTRPGDTTLFRRKHLSADIRLSYQKATQLLKLQTGKLKLEDASFDISGTVDLLHGNTVDLRFSGDKPDFHQLFSFAPESLAKELKHFRYDGILDFSGTMKGKWQGDKLPRIELS
ncbi:MAG TPA: AsmA family protein, partial [Puia sp.]|nr:AsmA family protein [Puia sp.]